MQFLESTDRSSPKNKPLDMNYWRKFIDDWDSSKESQKNYCQRLGLNLNTFTYLRGKLTQKNSVKSKFIPITLNNTKEQEINISNFITIENVKGLKLHIPPSVASEQLRLILNLSGW